MALEIERKWLVKKSVACDVLAGKVTGAQLPVEIMRMHQTYAIRGDIAILRVRTQTNVVAGTSHGYITVKGPSDVPGAVEEHEMEIPYESARALMRSCSEPVLSKNRFCIPLECGLIIELDEFTSLGNGDLFIAEVEFPSPDMAFDVPEWFGEEVTGQRKYTNASLVQNSLN